MSAEAETPEGNQTAPKKDQSPGFMEEMARDVGKDLASETKTTLKWALGGAIVGALIIGGIGFWLLGMKVLGVSALIGAVIGAIAGGWIYLWWFD